MQKTDWQNIDNSQSYAKKSDFDPPFWIDQQFLANLTKYEFKSCFWSKYKFIAKA
jgi:hypothetical protein